jgi:hypothetical protein
MSFICTSMMAHSVKPGDAAVASRRRGVGAVCLLSFVLSSSPTVRAQEGGDERQAPPAPGGLPGGLPGGAATLEDVYKPDDVSRAVERALVYLRDKQQADGSWLCGWGKNTGVISLSLMAYLAAGHQPGRGEYGVLLENGVGFLIRQRHGALLIRPKDTSHGPLYEHGITTLLLGEIRGLIDEDRPGFEDLARVHQEAVDVILGAQRMAPASGVDQGGWRYTPTTQDADLSVTGWQLLALRAAQDVRVDVPEARIEAAIGYIKRCADEESGGFTYMPRRNHKPNPAMTGTGVLSLEICGEFGSAEARRGGDWLLRHPLEWKGPFFYYNSYYSSQAMFQLGSRYWDSWCAGSRDLLLNHQESDGSWSSPPGETSVVRQLGPVYNTAMAVLALTVEFQYLPIYQR